MRPLIVVAALGLTSCFNPDYPVDLPCDPAGWCPPGQVCSVRNICVAADSDGGAIIVDAGDGDGGVDSGLGALQSISIGDDVQIEVGGTHQFVITATYENGTAVVDDFAIWDSSDNNIMFVDFEGVAHGQAAGAAVATCDYMGRVDTAVVTVVEPQ
jgi:hypothetical protein